MSKYYILTIILFIFLLSILYNIPVKADLPLQGKVIVIDPGHGGLDKGCSYKDIYESDINLSISLYLKEYLSSYGASVILTRENEYDLSNGVTNHRKKTDFDNRIKIINNEYVDMYLSIHINYLTDKEYYGAQVFYNNDNELLAQTIQDYLNENLDTNREIKQIPSNTYMYNKLTTKGVLIECGFLSNTYERELLVTEEYQSKFASILSESIVKYYK